jgi:4-hydroxybenzoate polyprenyltransferase
VRHLAKEHIVTRVLDTRRAEWRALVRALRPHQWVKNVLVFVPLLTSHKILQLPLLKTSAFTFAAFCLCASATYVLNDMFDIEVDRRHPRKRWRPFASGELSIPTGVLLAAVLLAGAALISFFAVSWSVGVVLITYVVATTSYSLLFKQRPVWDVFMLTALYLIRIVGGGIATQTFPSSWLLGFALFIFLSLAFTKRYTELLATNSWIPGRAYGPDDALWMHSIGTSSGYMAVLVLALYVNAREVTILYERPQVLWCLCPLLLLWVTRLWFRASRRTIHDDPVVEALTDWFSYVGLGVMAAIVLIAI